MPIYRVRRMWTGLLVVGVPTAIASVVWAVFFGGRLSTGALASVYLMIVLAGRAHSAEMERRARPGRVQRVSDQLDRVRSTLPGAEAAEAQCAGVQLRPVRTPDPQPRPAHSLASHPRSAQSLAGSSR